MSKKRQKTKKPDAKARQLLSAWEALVAKHAAPLERGATSKGLAKKPRPKRALLQVAPSTVYTEKGRDLKKHPSVNTFTGSATKKEVMKYTGTKMIGLGTLHKSNTVPVFSQEDAVDIAKMRRN